MQMISQRSRRLAMLAALCVAAPVSLAAQQYNDRAPITVVGTVPADLSGLAAGPDIEGIISARNGTRVQVTTEAGAREVVYISPSTEIRGTGGFLGLSKTEITAAALLNGLPVKVETVMWEGGLAARSIRYKNSDYETAAMIRGGTAQQFAEHGAMIEENSAATAALRSRMGDIDQYNIKGTTNVYFDSGKWNLTGGAEADLCAAADEAEAMDNALLLVVGYTDDVGDEDYNQMLSERRAGKVVNYLQQKCKWAPWRMLSPTGMAESDPLADNTTPAGRAQNRRVSVNILVSKAIDGL